MKKTNQIQRELEEVSLFNQKMIFSARTFKISTSNVIKRKDQTTKFKKEIRGHSETVQISEAL